MLHNDRPITASCTTQNTNEIQKFISKLHDLASNLDGELVLASIANVEDVPQKISNFRFSVGDVEGMLARAVEEASHPNRNVYFGSYVLKPGLVSGNQRGKRDEVLAVLLLGVDQDADHQREGNLPIDSNLVIKTSETARPDGSMAVNRQAFYIFDPASRPSVAEAAELGRALRQAARADTPTGDVMRLYRLPGTLNWPTARKIERGRSPEPQLVVIQQDAIGFVDPKELRLRCAKISPAHEKRGATEGIAATDLLDKATAGLRSALNRHDIDRDRSRAAWAALTMAVEEGFSDAEIEALVLAHPTGAGERYAKDQKSLCGDIARARAKADGRPDHAPDPDLPYGFRRAADGGLLYRRGGKDEQASYARLCSPLWVIARARDHDDNNWGRVVEIVTPTEEKRQIFIAASDLHVTNGDRDPLARLASAGLEIYEPGERSRLRKILAHPIDRFARVVRRTGWHHHTFILPHEAINGASGELHIWDGDESHQDAFRAKGSLQEWQSQVGEKLQNHPLLVLAASVAFVGPCLRLTDYPEDFGLHLFGPSSRGKTTALDVAASVWGNPDHFSRTWRGTSNGFESIAAARNDTLLVLDELRQVNPQDLSACIYMLSQGRGKQRASRSGDARRTHEWRLAYLSSGETSIADHLRSAPNQRHMAGQQIRCLELPLPDEGHGVFQGVSSSHEAAELSRNLKLRARSNYGAAGPAFVGGLTSDLERARSRLSELSDQFCAQALAIPNLPKADGQVHRALHHLGMIYSAGAMACELGVLPFPATRILQAVLGAFQAWITMRGGWTSFEEEGSVTAIRDFIELHPSRFQAPLAEADGYAPRERAGIKVSKDGRSYYAILPGVWKNEVCEGLNAKAAAKIALQHGFLDPERNSDGQVTNLQRKVNVDGCRVRAYWIKATILGEEAVDRALDEGDGEIVPIMTFPKRATRWG